MTSVVLLARVPFQTKNPLAPSTASAPTMISARDLRGWGSTASRPGSPELYCVERATG